MTAQKFYRQVLIEAGRPSLEDARRVTAGVFHTLRDRLTPNEADQAAAQLPRPLKLLWWDGEVESRQSSFRDRKSTRLNSSHQIISYAVFCLKKKTKKNHSQV